jgi:hypothetical protein
MKHDGHDQDSVDKRISMKNKRPIGLLFLGHQEKGSEKLNPQQKDKQQS